MVLNKINLNFNFLFCFVATKRNIKVNYKYYYIYFLITMSNRIQNAIDKMNIRLLNLSKNKIATIENSFNDIDDMELIEYQKTQSFAFASNLLTLEEANLVYNILGREFPCVEKFNNRSLSEKIIITQLMKELIEKIYF